MALDQISLQTTVGLMPVRQKVTPDFFPANEQSGQSTLEGWLFGGWELVTLAHPIPSHMAD